MRGAASHNRAHTGHEAPAPPTASQNSLRPVHRNGGTGDAFTADTGSSGTLAPDGGQQQYHLHLHFGSPPGTPRTPANSPPTSPTRRSRAQPDIASMLSGIPQMLQAFNLGQSGSLDEVQEPEVQAPANPKSLPADFFGPSPLIMRAIPAEDHAALPSTPKKSRNVDAPTSVVPDTPSGQSVRLPAPRSTRVHPNVLDGLAPAQVTTQIVDWALATRNDGRDMLDKPGIVHADFWMAKGKRQSLRATVFALMEDLARLVDRATDTITLVVQVEPEVPPGHPGRILVPGVHTDVHINQPRAFACEGNSYNLSKEVILELVHHNVAAPHAATFFPRSAHVMHVARGASALTVTNKIDARRYIALPASAARPTDEEDNKLRAAADRLLRRQRWVARNGGAPPSFRNVEDLLKNDGTVSLDTREAILNMLRSVQPSHHPDTEWWGLLRYTYGLSVETAARVHSAAVLYSLGAGWAV